jgi:hypothetical protein
MHNPHLYSFYLLDKSAAHQMLVHEQWKKDKYTQNLDKYDLEDAVYRKVSNLHSILEPPVDFL